MGLGVVRYHLITAALANAAFIGVDGYGVGVEEALTILCLYLGGVGGSTSYAIDFLCLQILIGIGFRIVGGR